MAETGTTYEWVQKKGPEKTWPVNIGDLGRYKVLAIITKIHGDTGHLVTQRSVVEQAIARLYKEIVGDPSNPPVVEVE